jgi:hypothetical protein
MRSLTDRFYPFDHLAKAVPTPQVEEFLALIGH